MWDHIVSIIALPKRWLLQIKQGFCMGTKDKNHPGIKCILSFWIYEELPWSSGVIWLKFKGSCLAGQYLESIGFDSVEQWWRLFLQQRSIKHAGTFLKVIESLWTILEEHWKSICKSSYWRNKVMVSHLFTNNQVLVGTASKANFPKKLINSEYLVSIGHSIEFYAWITPLNMTVVLKKLS